jgi:hypothetical protein
MSRKEIAENKYNSIKFVTYDDENPEMVLDTEYYYANENQVITNFETTDNDLQDTQQIRVDFELDYKATFADEMFRTMYYYRDKNGKPFQPYFMKKMMDRFLIAKNGGFYIDFFEQ